MYNIGLGAFQKSGLLKGLKAGLGKLEVKALWLKWVFAGKKKLSGLEKRRKAEWDWFSGDEHLNKKAPKET